MAISNHDSVRLGHLLKLKVIAGGLILLVMAGWLFLSHADADEPIAATEKPADKNASAKANAAAALSQEQQQLVVELTSGDADRVKAAEGKIQYKVRKTYDGKPGQLQFLVDAKLFDIADKIAVNAMMADPGMLMRQMAALEKFRAQTFIDREKWPEALSAAKAFFYSCELKDTNDAINMPAICVVNAHSEDPTIGSKFKRQQIASASENADQPEPAEDPILKAITIDGSPFEKEISSTKTTNWKNCMYKGNLLLVARRAREARIAFELAVTMADDKQMAPSIEAVARAVRDVSGSVGPANAYILSVRNGGAP